MIRLADIAKRAGVSLGAVSAALNGAVRGNIRLSQARREHILAIAKEMNYVPNLSAQCLSGRSSHTLGVLVDSQDAAVRFRQLAAIEREADKRGYRIIVAESHEDSDKLWYNCRTLLQYGVDAVLSPINFANEELRREKKVVFYGAEAVPGCRTVYYDVADGYAVAFAQFRREKRNMPSLILSGNLEDSDSIRARYAAFMHEFPGGEENICNCPAIPASTEELPAFFRKIVDDFVIPRRIDAIVAQNDLCALALLHSLWQCGIRVPQDCSLVGHDNSDFCPLVEPALTSIDPNLEEFGKAVVDLTVEYIEHPDLPVRTVAVPTRLCLRGTTMGGKNG